MKGVKAILRRIQRLRFVWSPSYRHCCQKCGFLGFQGNSFRRDLQEATSDVRRVIAADGQAGWFDHESAVDCFRHLWNWDDESAVAVITYEANRPRYFCRGFYRYSPGRPPEAHLKLEDEHRGYSYQRRLAWLAFVGALAGALMGVLGQSWLKG